MRILVTGISGFIGSHLAERLLNEGHQVAGLVRQTNRMNYPAFNALRGRAEFYYGSLADPVAVEKTVADFRPEAICHLGAISPVAYSFEHPDEVTKTNYLGTVYLAEAALRHCENLKKFLYASSMEVYGFQDKREPFVETDEVRPACPYAVAKVASEKYLQYLHYAHGFPCVIFRQTNAYGRKENDYFVVEAALTQMLRGPVVNLGDPRPVRNFLFIDDLVELYVHMLAAERSLHGEVFNTGPANGVSIAELVAEISRQLNWHGQVNWHTRPKRPGEIFYLNSSNEKVSAAIAWEPRVRLEEGIRRTIGFWRERVGEPAKSLCQVGRAV